MLIKFDGQQEYDEGVYQFQVFLRQLNGMKILQ